MVDCGRDPGDHLCRIAFERLHMKPSRKFLGDEAGREPAGLPTRVGHQCCKKWNIMAEAIDHEKIEGVALRWNIRIAGWGVRGGFGKPPGVVDGEFARLVNDR